MTTPETPATCPGCEQQAAAALLADMLAAAARHGVTADDFARVADLPAACTMAVRGKTRP